MFEKNDRLKATFELSRILSDSQYDGEPQLVRALEHIGLILGADRAYLSQWDESEQCICTAVQWNIQQLDPMPLSPVRVEKSSMLEDFFSQNRGMTSLVREPILFKNSLIGVFCLETRDPVGDLTEDERKLVAHVVQIIAPLLANLNLSVDLKNLNLQSTEDEPPIPSSEEGSPRVLIVEDNQINQLTLLKMLQRNGIQVEVADDGLQGINACQRQKFDLILMDLSMPYMDGFDTAREIVTNCSLNKTTPIIAVTANVTENVENRCLKVGMVEYIAKPLRMERVRELISKYLSKEN